MTRFIDNKLIFAMLINNQSPLMKKFVVIGLSYKKANEDIRGRFSLSEEQQKSVLTAAAQDRSMGFIISTCNRTEIYALASDIEDVFQKCNHADAPWFVIPADNKWYRDASVAGIVRDTLRKMNPQMPPVEVDLDEIQRYYDQELDKLGR